MKPKRLISLLVAVCMMITMLPLSAVTAFAADTSTDPEDSYKGYKYAYKVNGGNATITKFLGPVDSTNNGSYDIEIPAELGGYTVTGIGNRAFYGCADLTEVTIPQSVTSIGERAFTACRNLNSLTINDAATSIGNRAFTECPLATKLSLGKKITTIDDYAFYDCRGLTSVIIPPSVTSIGDDAFLQCIHLKTLSFGENIKTNIETIGDDAFYYCIELESVTIPQSVTSIGNDAFGQCHDLQSLTIKDAATSIGHRAFFGCTSLATISLGENIKTIGNYAFASCTCIDLTNVTIPENVTTIGPGTFRYCTHLEYIMLPAGLTSFQDSLIGCPAGNPNGAIYYNNYKTAADALLADNDNNSNIADNDKLKNRNFLYLCNVIFDAKGGSLTGYAEVPVYKTEKITDTKANELTAINDPTRAGYKFTGWYTEDGQPFDVNDTAITEDITLYAGWKFDPNAPGCHPLTVTGGTVTVKYDGSDVTSKLNSKTDAATGQKTYSVPDGATVTVTLDKTAVPNGKVFDGWSTGEFSLPTGQDYKAESITFTMNSDVNVSAKYRDAATDHTTVAIEGLENAVIKEGESKDFTVKVTPNDDAKLGEAFIDFGDKNSEIEYKDKNGEYQSMPEGGLKINLGDGETKHEFRITPKETGKQTLTAAVKQDKNELARDEKDFVVSEMPILTLKDGVITSVTVPGKDGADPEDITEIVKKNANEDGSFNVPEGATVSVAFDKDAFADSGLKFGHWDITGLDDPNAYQDKESFAFVMPAKAVTLKAMTQDASIEDDEPDIVGPIVIGTTVVVGGAVLGYQAYSLGAEFAGKLMALPYFPSNRSALAMMLWEDAGKPMPESELLYPDVGQEERDMDLQHAARWAMENDLVPDLNDEGTAPEEMKFYPDNTVSKIDVLNAWQKAQELKQNA